MSFFDSKQKESAASGVVTQDILSQVRVMGEKAPSPLVQGVNANTQTRNPLQEENPVSNPFIQGESAPGNLPIETGEKDTVVFPNMVPTPETTLPGGANIPVPQPEQNAVQHGDSFEKKEHSSKVLIIGSILGIALLLIIGIYFYLEKVKDTEIAQKETQVVVPNEPDTTKDVVPAPPTNPFSLERANYFSLNTETATKESIMAQLKDNATKMQEASVVAPVSFQVTDENNIPLALSRFVFLADLKVPEAFLSSLDEDFNIVLYSDNGQMRLGMALKFKEDIANPSEVLAPVEGTLPQIFAPLLYPSDVTLPITITFGTGTYNNFPVRYANVAPEKMYSFDYILQNKLLYIGNSKEVARKTFDVGVR